MSLIRSGLLAVALFAGIAGCGDDDSTTDASGADEAIDAPVDNAVEARDDGESAGGAEVVVRGETYDFSDGSCRTAAEGAIIAKYSVGDDDLSFTVSDGLIAIRATLDGAMWVAPESDVLPDVDGGLVTWTGDLLEVGATDESDDATITVHC